MNKNILVGTVGYHILRNHSIGPVLLPQLLEMKWPECVHVEEMNWGPIAIVQKFEDLKTPYDRVVFLVAIERFGRQKGDISVYSWQGTLPDERSIQACVGDAATGVISVENLLVIGEYFKIWPNEVFLVDVEPGAEQSGEGLSWEVEKKIPKILDTVYHTALHGFESVENIECLYGSKLFESNEK